MVPDERLSLNDGAVSPWAKGDKRLLTEMLEGLQRAFGIDPALPFGKLPRKLRDIVSGAPGRRSKSGKAFSARTSRAFSRIFGAGSTKDHGPTRSSRAVRALRPCLLPRRAAARGGRAVRVKGRRLADYVSQPIAEALPMVEGIELSEREFLIAGRVLKEIRDRLRFLLDVGVGYLTLSRSAATLSGEASAFVWRHESDRS